MLDTPLRKVAQTVLKKFGTDVTFTHSTPGVYDPATGTAGAPTTTSQTVKGRLDGYSNRELGANPMNQNTGQGIRADDRKLIVAAADLDAVPDVDDTVSVAGEVFDIVNIDTTLATDLAAIYTFQLRR